MGCGSSSLDVGIGDDVAKSTKKWATKYDLRLRLPDFADTSELDNKRRKGDFETGYKHHDERTVIIGDPGNPMLRMEILTSRPIKKETVPNTIDTHDEISKIEWAVKIMLDTGETMEVKHKQEGVYSPEQYSEKQEDQKIETRLDQICYEHLSTSPTPNKVQTWGVLWYAGTALKPTTISMQHDTLAYAVGRTCGDAASQGKQGILPKTIDKKPRTAIARVADPAEITNGLPERFSKTNQYMIYATAAAVVSKDMYTNFKGEIRLDDSLVEKPELSKPLLVAVCLSLTGLDCEKWTTNRIYGPNSKEHWDKKAEMKKKKGSFTV